MRQIKVDPLDGGVFRDNHVKGGSGAAANVDNGGEAVEASVNIENFLHGDGGVIGHSLVEHLVESGVSAMVLECSHSIGLIEWNSTIKNCIFQIIPAFNLIIPNVRQSLWNLIILSNLLSPFVYGSCSTWPS